MSEEEKEAIEKLKEYALCKVDDNGYVEVSANGYKHTILNLIEKQQKELNNLKEIEKPHQEENAKLRVEFEKVYEDNLTLANELEQEKEKNKELEEKLKIAVAMLTKGAYPEENEGDNDFDKYFISKEKIKGMINYREFELQQEYKEFEEDVEWRTYKKILEV